MPCLVLYVMNRLFVCILSLFSSFNISEMAAQKLNGEYRLQGVPDDFVFENKRSSYKLIGNAVPVHMGKWVGSVAMKYFN